MNNTETVGKSCIWGGANPCGKPGRPYLSGWFCDPHSPWALRLRQQGAVRRLVRPVEGQAAA
jgi:hypothetical protein